MHTEYSALLQAIQDQALPQVNDRLYPECMVDLLNASALDAIRYLLNQTEMGHPDQRFDFLSTVIQSQISGELKAAAMDVLTPFTHNESLIFNIEEIIFQLTNQHDSNLAVVEKAIALGLNIDADSFLLFGCSAIMPGLFELLTQHYTFNSKVLEQAFQNVIDNDQWGETNNHETQNNLIRDFIQHLHLNVNLAGRGDHAWLFQSCFENAPYAAKYFYTPAFNPQMLEDEDFWEHMADMYLEDEDVAGEYEQAFRDLRASGIEFDKSAMMDVLETRELGDFVEIMGKTQRTE
ncbi:hypothetical protein [Photobacterium sp. 1_MG-2023]|uniref:hypothetical protein n=1 Tax=Photobacterium sp. 1_MG-2023 TaxID=3062646 RepID=UPI0026E39656|nr:hypothetical protein [Photobacterium sp. 1_MG-2023]MDO6708928.1 hypothetical protein [Photobacterium sp. 1_MG-2023]